MLKVCGTEPHITCSADNDLLAKGEFSSVEKLVFRMSASHVIIFNQSICFK